jgi:GT2 family glycosyltransferase
MHRRLTATADYVDPIDRASRARPGIRRRKAGDFLERLGEPTQDLVRNNLGTASGRVVDIAPRKRQQPQGNDLATAHVSIIVPTRNSSITLAACLESARHQDHSDVELIVVDNHSTDGTQEIAHALADVLVIAGPERSAQRNAGARASVGEYLLFIDSDMVLEHSVVSECVAAGKGGARSVVIPEVSFGEGYWTRCKALERSCYIGDDTIEAARFFTREAFDLVGGFDENIHAGPEDWDLHERVRAGGQRPPRTSALIWHNEGHLRLRETIATKYYYGKGAEVYFRKHSGTARKQARLFRPAFARHWRKLARQPLTTAGMMLMKALELAAGAAGVLAVRINARRTGAPHRHAPHL